MLVNALSLTTLCGAVLFPRAQSLIYLIYGLCRYTIYTNDNSKQRISWFSYRWRPKRISLSNAICCTRESSNCWTHIALLLKRSIFVWVCVDSTRCFCVLAIVDYIGTTACEVYSRAETCIVSVEEKAGLGILASEWDLDFRVLDSGTRVKGVSL